MGNIPYKNHKGVGGLMGRMAQQVHHSRGGNNAAAHEFARHGAQSSAGTGNGAVQSSDALAKLPKSLDAMQQALGFTPGSVGGRPTDLFLFNMSSGNAVGIGTGHTQTDTGTNTYQVDVSDQFDPTDLAVAFDAGSTDGFQGSDNNYADPGSGEWAELAVFRITSSVTASRQLMNNFISGSGTKLSIESDNELRWHCDGVVAQQTTPLVVNTWYAALMWYSPSTEVGLSFELGTVINTTSVPASIATATRAWGLPGVGSPPAMQLALWATFSGANAAALRAPQAATFSSNAGLS